MAAKIPVGAEPKKIAALVALLVVFVVVYYMNSGPSYPEQAQTPATRPGPASPVAPVATAPRTQPQVRRANSTNSSTAVRGGARSRLDEFRPSLKIIRETITDPAQLEPTLKLETMARLQNTKYEGGSRSLFDFSGGGAAPAAAIQNIPKVKPVKPTVDIAAFIGPEKPKPEPPPVKPQAPPIPLKFYGFIQQSRPGPRRGFFLDGEDIIVAAEGDTIRSKYRVIRIAANMAELEDVSFEQKQTLPLVQENQGS